MAKISSGCRIKISRLKQIFLAFFLEAIIIRFVVGLSNDKIDSFLNGPLSAGIFLLFIFLGLWFFLISLSYTLEKNHLPPGYNIIVLFPTMLLPLWNKYAIDSSIIKPLIIVALAIICNIIVLLNEKRILAYLPANDFKQKMFIFLFVILYFVIFSYLYIQKFNSFAIDNTKDFAIYNQTFWNTINGNLFANSTYGSNFTCHNSPFYFFLIPFYYLMPHPLTLSILKILLFCFSSIFFYRIAKTIIPGIAIPPLVAAFLFYPYLVSQNFSAPYEISYSPFFLLATYYFFSLKKIFPFIIFLLLTLSIKEHLSLIAVMFGAYAIFQKRNIKWAITPLIMGIFWGIASIIIIRQFQNIYNPHPDASWLIVNLKQRFFTAQDHNLAHSIISGLAGANLSKPYLMQYIFLFLSPLAIIVPLFSPVIYLGLPEFLLTLIADRPVMLFPQYHYNIITSCFLFIAAVEGIKKIAHSRTIKKINIKPETCGLLLAIFILSSTLIHSPTWTSALKYSKDTKHTLAIKKALSLIPGNASVTIPAHLAVYVSAREDYSLIEQKDYILKYGNPKDTLEKNSITGYDLIFNQEGIELLKRRDLK